MSAFLRPSGTANYLGLQGMRQDFFSRALTEDGCPYTQLSNTFISDHRRQDHQAYFDFTDTDCFETHLDLSTCKLGLGGKAKLVRYCQNPLFSAVTIQPILWAP